MFCELKLAGRRLYCLSVAEMWYIVWRSEFWDMILLCLSPSLTEPDYS